jgi:hypothetical protein
MKRAIIASILGIAASVATTRGDGGGVVIFSTYFSSSSYVAFEYKGGKGPVADNFTVQMYYGLGSNLPFNTLTPYTARYATVWPEYGWAIVVGSPETVDISSYVSGPVTFALVAYDGNSWDSSTIRTQPDDVWTWTEPSIALRFPPAQPQPPTQWSFDLMYAAAAAAGDIDDGTVTRGPYYRDLGLGDYEAPYVPVSAVPEPGTLALAGLGAAAMLIFRRRQ